MSVNPDQKTSSPDSGETPETKGGDAIDASLVKYYNDLLNEPLPDRFKDLLKQLEAKEKE